MAIVWLGDGQDGAAVWTEEGGSLPMGAVPSRWVGSASRIRNFCLGLSCACKQSNGVVLRGTAQEVGGGVVGLNVLGLIPLELGEQTPASIRRGLFAKLQHTSPSTSTLEH